MTAAVFIRISLSAALMFPTVVRLVKSTGCLANTNKDFTIGVIVSPRYLNSVTVDGEGYFYLQRIDNINSLKIKISLDMCGSISNSHGFSIRSIDCEASISSSLRSYQWFPINHLLSRVARCKSFWISGTQSWL